MDRTGLQIERGRGVDDLGEIVEPGGLQPRVRRQPNLVETFHDVAKDRALGAAGGAHLLLQLFFVVRCPLRAHHDHFQVVVVIDAGDDIVGAQHVLVFQVTDRQQVRMVADGHHCDHFLGVQVKRQGLFRHHLRVDRTAVLIDPAN